MWGDLLLNLVSEVVGILVTVFLVDKLIQRREEKRWLPAKYNVYFHLFCNLTDLIHFLGMFDRWKVKKHHYYYFGAYYVATTYDVKKLKSNNEKLSGIPLMVLNHISISSLKEASANIQNIVNDQPQLLEPELLSHLLLLEERLEPVINKLDHYLDVDPDDREGSVDLHFLAEEIIRSLVWLSKQTSKTRVENSEIPEGGF